MGHIKVFPTTAQLFENLNATIYKLNQIDIKLWYSWCNCAEPQGKTPLCPSLQASFRKSKFPQCQNDVSKRHRTTSWNNGRSATALSTPSLAISDHNILRTWCWRSFLIKSLPTHSSQYRFIPKSSQDYFVQKKQKLSFRKQKRRSVYVQKKRSFNPTAGECTSGKTSNFHVWRVSHDYKQSCSWVRHDNKLSYMEFQRWT